MSTEATLDVGGDFPVGTELGAVPRTLDTYNGGPVHAKAKVHKDGTVTFKGLVENGPYWLVGKVDGQVRAQAFTAHDDEIRGLEPDEAATQEATRLGIEKAAAGALAVRDESEAPAAPESDEKPAPPVVGARSSSRSKPRRSMKRGADSPKARSK